MSRRKQSPASIGREAAALLLEEESGDERVVSTLLTTVAPEVGAEVRATILGIAFDYNKRPNIKNCRDNCCKKCEIS